MSLHERIELLYQDACHLRALLQAKQLITAEHCASSSAEHGAISALAIQAEKLADKLSADLSRLEFDLAGGGSDRFADDLVRRSAERAALRMEAAD